jgi:hypothetical protein
MPASRTSKPKRLPPNFGAIDPLATWDSPRFFTALRATGHKAIVLYSIDEDEVAIQMNVDFPKTRLQLKRLSDLAAWERNKDPKRHLQFAYVRDLISIFHFEPRTEADGVGPRYFHFPIN